MKQTQWQTYFCLVDEGSHGEEVTFVDGVELDTDLGDIEGLCVIMSTYIILILIIIVKQ